MSLPLQSQGPSLRAICTLVLAIVWVAMASAGAQASGSDSAAPKPATKKTKTHHTSASSGSKSTASKRTSRRKKVTRVRGQKKIDADRVRTIQEALIREHYLSGEPTGDWNEESEAAMRRYQGDHGWQTKEVPDSRALIKLGLGPANDHLLNPESAMTTTPDVPRSQSAAPTSHTGQPGAATSTPSPTDSDPPSPQ